MKVILLVAGYATRLYPLTKDMPKALIKINKKPIIEYILDEVNTIKEVDQIYLVSNHIFADNFIQWEKTYSCTKPIHILDDGTTNNENRLGAIGDINFTINDKNIDDDLMIIAGDNFFTYKLQDYVDFFNKANKDCVVVKEIDDVEILKGFAVAKINNNNIITHLEEKPEIPLSNIGVFATYLYKKETVKLFKEYLEQGNKPDAPGYFVSWLYTKKEVAAYVMDGECYDIGTFAALDEVNALFSDKN